MKSHITSLLPPLAPPIQQGPAVSMVRRHARSNRSFHYGPAVQVISGNYVAAKRRGVVGGVDYMHTGVVRFVQVDAIRKQLDHGNVVLLSNLGKYLCVVPSSISLLGAECACQQVRISTSFSLS